MTITAISTFGTQTAIANRLSDNQKTIATLTEQLTTGRRSREIGGYDSFEIRSILDFSSEINRREGYIQTIETVRPRLALYERGFGEFERIIDDSLRLINNSPSGPLAQNLSVQSQVQQSMREMQILLNERLEERFLYSGTRYNTPPVGDITSLPTVPVEAPPYTVVEPNLPSYDTEAALSPQDPAWVRESVIVEDGFSLQYGVVSTDPAIQQLVMGLRWMNAAVNDGPSFANYQTYMTTANNLLTEAKDNIRTLRADVVADINVLDRFKLDHQESISSFSNEIDDIRNVDTNEVSVKLTQFQNQVEASYAASAILIRLSLLDFL